MGILRVKCGEREMYNGAPWEFDPNRSRGCGRTAYRPFAVRWHLLTLGQTRRGFERKLPGDWATWDYKVWLCPTCITRYPESEEGRLPDGRYHSEQTGEEVLASARRVLAGMGVKTDLVVKCDECKNVLEQYSGEFGGATGRLEGVNCPQCNRRLCNACHPPSRGTLCAGCRRQLRPNFAA